MSIGNKKGIRRKKFVWGPSLTKPEFADETNINKIIAKFMKTGVLTSVKDNPGMYTDLANVGNYHESLNKIIAAKETFQTLPANIRKRFGNDPGQLVDFMSDPQNLDEAVKLGLARAPKIEKKPAPPAQPATPPETPPKEETPPTA